MTTAAILASLLLSLCLAALQQADAYDHEANRLLEFINSGVSSSQHGWDNLSRAKKASSVYLGPQDGLMEADKVDALPGQPQGVDFDQYAGYVTVDPSSGRALFYYFAESPDDADTKPLILWLNGGPGCSSLGGGAMVELGPFRANSDGKTLYANSHSWNNVANVIFLESPAGVGFSYSNTTSDYKLSGDTRTADDTYTFLVNWLERFPRYKGRDFFVAGESYGGHYIPELASTILTNNKIYNNNTINLKGIAIGNGLFDVDTNNRATFDYYWTHALISDEAHSAIRSKCTFAGQNFSADCASALRSADAEIGNIDRYDIYAPLCRDSSGSTGSTTRMMEVDPCSGDYASSYLNLPEVQRALHANVTGLPYPWSACSAFVGGHGNWTDAPTTLLPIIKDLIASGIRLWLYSGDQDSVCPVTSTRYSINTLGLPVESPWRPWYDDGEVGGYVVAYEGLTFVTVRGAGHMVPSYQPERALTLFSSFLGGKLPPPA